MSDERIQQIKAWLRAGGAESEYCKQEFTWLIGELRDARAEAAELKAAIDRTAAATERYVANRLADARAEVERLQGVIAAMDDDADQALTATAEAVEAESQAGDQIAAERDDLRAEVERLHAEAADQCVGCERPTESVDCQCWACKLSDLEEEVDDLRAKLAAVDDRRYEWARRALAQKSARFRAEWQLAAVRKTAAEILGTFTEHGHPGRPCLRSGWISVEMVERWRAALSSEGGTDNG